MSVRFNIHVPGINHHAMPVTVASPSEAEVRLFLTSVLNGMSMAAPASVNDCQIEKIDTPDPLIYGASYTEIFLDERGISSGYMIDRDAANAAILMSLYSAAGNAMASLKKITPVIEQCDDGRNIINLEDAYSVMSFANASLNAATVDHLTQRLCGEIALLQHHPAIRTLRDLIAHTDRDSRGTVFISADGLDALKRAADIIEMTPDELQKDSLRSLLTHHGLAELLDQSPTLTWWDFDQRGKRGEIEFNDAVALCRAIKHVTQHDPSLETNKRDDLLIPSPTSNKEIAP